MAQVLKTRQVPTRTYLHPLTQIFPPVELFTNCRKAATLYDNVRIREELGEELSAKARCRLLQGEYDTLREIRTSLHIARLGPGEGREYRDKMTTEAARKDFEATFTDPKEFKYYMSSLAEVKKSGRSRRRSGSSSFLNTGPYRTPRRSRRGRRGSSKRGRSSYSRSSNSGRRHYSSRGSSRYNSGSSGSRRNRDNPSSRRRPRF